MRFQNRNTALALSMIACMTIGMVGNVTISAQASSVADEEEKVTYIVQTEGNESLGKIAEKYHAQVSDDSDSYNYLEKENCILLDLSKSQAAKLENMDEVDFLEKDLKVQGSSEENTQVATPSAIIKYKEKAYDCPIKKLTNVETMHLKMIPSGKVQFELNDYWAKEIWNIARVTYDSKGKKQVEKAVRANLGSNNITLYGDRGYTVKNKTLVVGKRIKSGKKVSWKILKKIKFDVSEYRKKENDVIRFSILEVTGKNTVKLVYSHLTGSRYCGIIQVNVATGKVKKLISKDGYLGIYDGKYLYERKLESGKLNLCCTSLKSKKVEQFTVESESLSEMLSEDGEAWLSCYNRNIMVLGVDGKIYYGTFDSKKLEQVGDISACKNYKKYEVCGFAMKSKNEFYLSYSPKIKKGAEYDHTYGRVFLAKYYK